jgi:polyisoprenoid-binding protein YceI
MVGSTAARPYGMGPAIGFSAKGTFSRSQFGMTYLVPQPGQPELVGDQVTIEFEGEFQSSPTQASQGAKTKN